MPKMYSPSPICLVQVAMELINHTDTRLKWLSVLIWIVSFALWQGDYAILVCTSPQEVGSTWLAWSSSRRYNGNDKQ